MELDVLADLELREVIFPHERRQLQAETSDDQEKDFIRRCSKNRRCPQGACLPLSAMASKRNGSEVAGIQVTASPALLGRLGSSDP